MNLREMMAALRSGWWLLLLGACLGGASGAGVVALQSPIYESSAQLFVSTAGTTSSSDFFQGGQFYQQRVKSYARLLTGEDLAERLIERLDLPDTAEEFRERIEVSVEPDTVLIDVTVSARTPAEARDVATVLASEFASTVQGLEPTVARGSSPVKVTVTDQPNLPEEASAPRPVRDITLGVLVGLLTGIALALARRLLDRSVKTPVEAAAAAGAPVIGVVVRDGALDRAHVITDARVGRAAEDYRQLRNNLQFLDVDQSPRVIMISSSLPGEGKTTAVVNLGLALADAGKSVVIVEADLRRPRVTEYMGLIGGVGLTNVLTGSAGIEDVLQRHGHGGVSVMAAGPTPPNPGELLASAQMANLVADLRSRFEFVLVDAPPVLPVADASGLAVSMDGVLLSVRHGSTRRDQLELAAQTLNGVGTRVLGVILNLVSVRSDVATARGYGYGYDSTRPSTPAGV